MAKEVTLKTLAKKLNISPSLACRALNDRYGVSDEIRELVKKTAEEMNYRPRISSTPSSQKLVFLFLDIALSGIFSAQDIYSNMIDGICQHMNAKSICIEPFFLQNYKPSELIAIIKNRQSCGGISIGRIGQDYIQAIHNAGMPLITVDPYHYYDQPVDSVRANNFAVGYRAAKHLVELGHRDLAFVGNSYYSISFKDRLDGFVYYIKNCGIKNIRWTSIEEELSPTSHICSDEKILDFLHSPDRPSGIMCANDACACVVIHHARTLGLSIPEDFSLVGCDTEQNFQRSMQIKISSFSLYSFSMGVLAAELLLNRIENSNFPTQYLQIEPEFFLGETTAPFHPKE